MQDPDWRSVQLDESDDWSCVSFLKEISKMNCGSVLYHRQVGPDRIRPGLSKEKWPLERNSTSLLPVYLFIFLSSAKCRIWKGMVLSSVLKLSRMFPQLVNGKINFKGSSQKFCEI